MIKKFRVAAATVLVGAALTASAAALPAEAASFGPRYVPGGNYSYNDGKDSFCVNNAGPGTSIYVTLTPSSTKRGHVHEVSSIYAKGERTKCVSLARAYEDTRYTASVTSFKNGVKYVATPYSFYS